MASDLDRLRSHLAETASGCWEFQGSRAKSGLPYGRFGFCGGPQLAHRVAWTLMRGDIPPGLRVLHHCDNPPCVRPDHLFVGTSSDNSKDRDGKMRRDRRPGERCNLAKLTDDDAVDIRSLRALGARPDDLATAFEVHRATIDRVCSGYTWSATA